MNFARSAIAVGLIAALNTSAGAALAATPADQAAAAALFADARKLAAAGDITSACPKFAESQRLDPTAGGGLSVGDCLEKLGKLASAWGAFKEAEILARDVKDPARAAEAARRAEALAGRLSKLEIVVPSAARVPGLELRRDGVVIGEGQWGAAMPVDPGQHTVEASAPGRKPWSQVVDVGASGASKSVELPVLKSSSAAATDGDTGRKPLWNGQRIAGLVLGGGGLVSMAVGAGFAAKAAGKNSDSLPYCLPNDETKCNAAGVALRNDAFNASKVSTVTFIAGGILAATGLIVFLTAPSSDAKNPGRANTGVQAQPIIMPTLAGLNLLGSF